MAELPTHITIKKANLTIKKATAYQVDDSKFLRTDVMPIPENTKKIRFRYFDKYKKGEFFWTKWFLIKYK
jgi:hypothetical protein